MWSYVPETDFPYAQVAADLNSDCSLPSRVSLAAALLNGTATPRPFSWATWPRIRWTALPPTLQLVACLTEILRFHCIRPTVDAMPDLSTRPGCGPTCERSSVMDGAGISTSSVRGILASRSAPPASVLEAMTRGTSGPTLPEFFGKPGLNGDFSKTYRGTSASALKPCCETYGTWAGRLRLAYSRRLKQVQRTSGSGSLSWPTATTEAGLHNRKGASPTSGDGLSTAAKAAVRLWIKDGTTWATPRGSDGEKGGSNQSFGGGGIPLATQTAHWPTPAAQNVKGSSPNSVNRADGKSRMDILHYRAEQGFPHPAQPMPTYGVMSCEWRPVSRRLLRSAILSIERATLRRWCRMGSWRNRRLNSTFVEWLMRWPPGHALCECSETEWIHWSQDMRGALSVLPTASGPWIWKPVDEIEQPVQYDLFAELPNQ